jgi:hypothetical protein
VYCEREERVKKRKYQRKNKEAADELRKNK